jgi:ribonuclease D
MPWGSSPTSERRVTDTDGDTAAEVVPEPAAHAAMDVIETVEAYRAAVAAIAAGTGPVAVDAERASGFRYSQRAYLIQVFRRGAGVFLFDPPAIGIPLTELYEAIADEEWILHAASQDVACLREVGLDPPRIFDTELGARLAGLPRVGLGAVVEELLGIHLAKEHSAADWSTRPLPQSWLVYAALDVELLPELRDKVADLLESAGKMDIARQEFEAVLDRETVVRQDPWRRLSGIHGLRQARNLAVARELWTARDDYAREIDTAPGRLVPDGSLVAAARALPATKRDLAAIKEFTGRASRSQLDRWFEAIQRGMTTEDLPAVRPSTDTLPPPRVWVDKNPEADGRFKRARVDVAAVAEELDIPVENLLTPEYLRRVAWSPPDPISAETIGAALATLGARRWQVDALAQVIAEAFVQIDQTPETGENPPS